ncbi:MAG TPA: hypothetical protein VK484_05495 [Ferruginibacter sp.]|nr:hypothetical protein [Ferruginibacter sp.]
MEMLFILGVIIFLGYFYYKGKGGISSGFSYGDDSITINSKDLRIDYSDIMRVERDIARCTIGSVMHYGYLITYRDKNKKIKQFMFYKSLADDGKWGEFKVKLLFKNPRAIVSESLL